MSHLLDVRDIDVSYGPIAALRGVTVRVASDEVVAVVGANGAGKSTLLRTVSGLLRPTRGRIEFDGQDTGKPRAAQIVKRGISHVPEGRQIFARLSVVENLKMGAYVRRREDGYQEDLDSVLQIFPSLARRPNQLGGTLSGGEQQMLAIGRALMSRPRLLLLDEPSMGLSPKMTETIFDALGVIAQTVAMVIVEQNSRMALALARRGYLLENGSVKASGPAESLDAEAIRAAYLGD